MYTYLLAYASSVRDVPYIAATAAVPPASPLGATAETSPPPQPPPPSSPSGTASSVGPSQQPEPPQSPSQPPPLANEVAGSGSETPVGAAGGTAEPIDIEGDAHPAPPRAQVWAGLASSERFLHARFLFGRSTTLAHVALCVWSSQLCTARASSHLSFEYWLPMVH